MSTVHRRNSMRLNGFDYTAEGAYFVTLVTRGREPLFGEVIADEMILSEYGKIVDLTWQDIPNHNNDVALGAFVTMPNHIHGIIHLFPPLLVGAGSTPAPDIPNAGSTPAPNIPAPDIPNAGSTPAPNIPKRAGYEPAPMGSTGSSVALSEIVRQLKTFSAKRINALRGTPGAPVWQRNYYDRIIRNDREYAAIEAYILENPLHWLKDEENC